MGSTVQGEPAGEGVFKFNNGDEYKGYFSSGFPSGQGVYNWRDGKIYKGNFKEGMFEGEGTITFFDGSYVEGVWRQGRLEVIIKRSSRGTGSNMRIGTRFETYHQIADSPWDTWEGIIRGDYELWRESEKSEFEQYLKQQQEGWRNR